MSLLKADTIKPVTSGSDLSLQGDSGGSAVDCLNITSAGDINFTGNTNAKIKLPSAGGVYKGATDTAVLTESGGAVTLDNVAIGSSVTGLTSATVLQIVHGSYATATTVNTATFVAQTNLSCASITTSAAGHVLIQVSLPVYTPTHDQRTWYTLYRDTTNLNTTGMAIMAGSASALFAMVNFTYIDPIATAGSYVYKVGMRANSANTITYCYDNIQFFITCTEFLP